MAQTKVYVTGNIFRLDIAGSTRLLQDSKANINIQESETPGTWIIESDKLGKHEILFSDLRTEADAVYTAQTWDDFYTVNTGFDPASGNGASKLVWAATGAQEQDIVIVQDTETLLDIINMPFADFNASSLIFDTTNDWIDVSGIDDNAWIMIRTSYLGVIGDADVTPSFRLIPNRNDLNTYTVIHGQSSKQKNGKASSYLQAGFNGDTDVIQLFVETDKNETLSVISITVKIDLP